MNLEETLIKEECPYHRYLRHLYTSVSKVIKGRFVVFGIGYGFEIPKELYPRVIGVDISKDAVKLLREKGIEAFVGDVLKDFDAYKGDVLVFSLVLSQVTLYNQKADMKGIISKLLSEGKKVIIIDTPFKINHYEDCTFGCREVFKSTRYFGPLDVGGVNVPIGKMYSRYYIITRSILWKFSGDETKDFIVYAKLLGFSREEVRKIVKEYISRISTDDIKKVAILLRRILSEGNYEKVF